MASPGPLRSGLFDKLLPLPTTIVRFLIQVKPPTNAESYDAVGSFSRRNRVSNPRLLSCSMPRDTRVSMVQQFSFPELRPVLRLVGPVTGNPERLMMSGKLPLMLAVGAAGKFVGMVVPELKKRGANVRDLVNPDAHGGRHML